MGYPVGPAEEVRVALLVAQQLLVDGGVAEDLHDARDGERPLPPLLLAELLLDVRGLVALRLLRLLTESTTERSPMELVLVLEEELKRAQNEIKRTAERIAAQQGGPSSQ